MPWVIDPHSGGIKITNLVKEQVKERIQKHAAENYKGSYERIDVRFRNKFCYIDAYTTPDAPKEFPPDFPESREEFIERVSKIPTHLCRLRYFGNDNEWSLAFYRYSSEKYEPCMFENGSFYGTPEEAFDIGSLYL